MQKIYSNENFSSNPSKLNEKAKKLEVQKLYSNGAKLSSPRDYNSASNALTSSLGFKFSEKKSNLNDETLKKIISINLLNDENSNKNIANTLKLNDKVKISNEKGKFVVTNLNEKKVVRSFNLENNQSKIVNVLNQFHTINTDNLENFNYPNLEKVKISHKNFGVIEAYSAITTEGIVRNYNEDRVSIILNVPKPSDYIKDDWPKCSFFGIYDGHGGSNCADFLRDNLHKNVFKFLF